MIAVLAVFTFCLGIVITAGLSKTCDTILKINKEENQLVHTFNFMCLQFQHTLIATFCVAQL